MYEGGNNTFKNTYLSQKTSATLEVDKVLTGRKLQDQEFEFELKNDTTGQRKMMLMAKYVSRP